MDILIFAIIVLIVAALVCFAIDKIGLTDPFNRLIQALVVLLAALVILNRAGLV